MIYHIAHKEVWNDAVKNNSYKPISLLKEGFIHCSPKEKLADIVNNFYRGYNDLVLLRIDEIESQSKNCSQRFV